MRILTRLDDFLEPLNQGVWEVVIPKTSVNELPGTGWEKSGINVPSPGTIASYRKARFHAHETKTEWRVHLDRYNPKVNPLLHLVDDAPLFLMIGDTFLTLIMDTKRTNSRDTEEILKNQGFAWREQVVTGLFLGLVGLYIMLNPVTIFRGIFELILPLAIICLAVFVMVSAVRAGSPEKNRSGTLYRGIGIFCTGIIAYILPLSVWVIFILAILALWMISSAFMLLRRVVKGWHAVPEGFYSRLVIGIISLVLAILLVINPADILAFLVVLLGTITVLLGLTLVITGLRLRKLMNQIVTGSRKGT
jgi:uncharacterized membrane protein HdeD (DUF308 family)